MNLTEPFGIHKSWTSLQAVLCTSQSQQWAPAPAAASSYNQWISGPEHCNKSWDNKEHTSNIQLWTKAWSLSPPHFHAHLQLFIPHTDFPIEVLQGFNKEQSGSWFEKFFKNIPSFLPSLKENHLLLKLIVTRNDRVEDCKVWAHMQWILPRRWEIAGKEATGGRCQLDIPPPGPPSTRGTDWECSYIPGTQLHMPETGKAPALPSSHWSWFSAPTKQKTTP